MPPKNHKFLANFIFLEFQHLLSFFWFLCHVFVMFHCFPLYFHDSSVWCVMFNCFFSEFSYFCWLFPSLFIVFCHFSMGFFPFCLGVLFFFVGFLHVFIGFLLLCPMFSLVFLWFWLICQWFCCFNARKWKKWLKNRETMTRKWQENDRKTWQKKNTFFWQVSFSWIQNICDFSVMFLSCLIDVLDVFMILVCDVPFGFPCVT